MNKCISFEWAIKRLLRNKANFGILEGFMSELLMEDIKIDRILESESYQENYYDKYNRVDILVQNSKGELIIVEIQNDRDTDYIHRVLYGASKLLVENMKKGFNYDTLKKIICVSIVYFDLGHGEDYIYHGSTSFVGMHKHDVLKLQNREKNLYQTEQIHKIFPEYYIIKVNQFNDVAKNTLDEWIYFLKNEEIEAGYKAKGLQQAREELSVMKMGEAEKKKFDRWVEQLRYEHSMLVRNMEASKLEGIIEGRLERKLEGILEGKHEVEIEIARKCMKKGLSLTDISELTGLTEQEIKDLA